MKNSNPNESIFKKGSTTYYYSSLFFPKDIKKDVFVLYAFVRTVDDYVDHTPAEKEKFIKFYTETKKALLCGTSSNMIINNFIELSKKRLFKPEWILAFFKSMENDLYIKTYDSFKEVEEYMFGSAEVIGLMMAKIMQLPKEAEEAAKDLGKAMQFINFIRDISEDQQLKRTYIPHEDLQMFKVTSLPPTSDEQIECFIKLIRFEIARYKTLQKKAEAGFYFIPKKYLLSIKTASDMYNWTANEIDKNPMIIFKKKLKPKKIQVVAKVVTNLFSFR